jgi:hypothetical protein
MNLLVVGGEDSFWPCNRDVDCKVSLEDSAKKCDLIVLFNVFFQLHILEEICERKHIQCQMHQGQNVYFIMQKFDL